MRVGVVSDTHGHDGYTRQAVEVLRGKDVETVLHCGDIGSKAIVGLFGDWPTHFVFGNVDGDELILEEAIAAAGQTCHGRFGELELGGRRIAVVHGDEFWRVDEAIVSGAWDLVCTGHTHQAECRWHERTLVLNPGALYRATPHTLAVVDLATMEVERVVVPST